MPGERTFYPDGSMRDDQRPPTDMRPFKQYIEAIEVLFGDRSRTQKTAAAVRIRDLTGILQFPTTLASAQIVAAPTMADFNKLQRDVAAIAVALKLCADAMHTRVVTINPSHKQSL